MSERTLKIIIAIIMLLIIGGGGYYWYFYIQNPTFDEAGEVVSPFEFTPFGRNTVSTIPSQLTSTSTNQEQPSQPNEPLKFPKLRQLSATPVAGMSSVSTASTSIVRFMDRGTGHVYETDDVSNGIKKLSNTTLPKIYEIYWNKGLTNFILRYLRDETDTVSNFYAELRTTGTSTTETPYEIKGKYLSPDTKEVAVSPAGDGIFTWSAENEKGVGYISLFDEKNKVKVADMPLTHVTIDWPAATTLTVATKASASMLGYFYSIDTSTGSQKKILGGVRGLTAKLSRDTSKIVYSSGGQGKIKLSVIDLKNNLSQEILFKTISDKCIWSTLRKNEVYCAVPTEIPNALYPDDWYKGRVSFVDQIWHLDTVSGEVHLLANLLDISHQLIDATQLTLDPKENFLYFINKRDLSLWSLDLNQ